MSRQPLLLAFILLLAASMPVAACSIPVFRFALERWAPSTYEIVVFHRGLADADQKSLQTLDKIRANANLTWSEVDLRQMVAAELQDVWNSQPPTALLPWMVVRYPQGEGKRTIAWAGQLSADNLAMVLRSPTRERIARLLASGESALVLLEYGDAKADDRAAALIESQSARLKKSIEMPAPTTDGPQLLFDIPMRLALPLIRVLRSTTSEKFLIAALLGSEEGLEKVEGPILFPIFGRGRILCGLHGEDLCAEQIERAVRFLCKECSCEVKELNPGVDLLIDANWVAMLGEPIATEAPWKPMAAPAIPPGEPALQNSVDSKLVKRTKLSASRRSWVWLAVGVASLLLAASGFKAWRKGRTGP